MTTAPDDLHGAWARRSASVGGSEPFESQHVIWLQARTCYADLRVPFAPGAQARCFTGRSGWQGDRYHWSRHLDLEPVGGDDVGDLSWEGDAVVERGMFPTADGEVPYEEEWVRLPGSDGPFLALEGEAACLVRVGDHAITVVDERAEGGDMSAAYCVRDDEGWVLVYAIGAGAGALPDPSDPPDWPVIHRGTVGVMV
jgi:hypothetical protein